MTPDARPMTAAELIAACDPARRPSLRKAGNRIRKALEPFRAALEPPRPPHLPPAFSWGLWWKVEPAARGSDTATVLLTVTAVRPEYLAADAGPAADSVAGPFNEEGARLIGLAVDALTRAAGRPVRWTWTLSCRENSDGRTAAFYASLASPDGPRSPAR